MENVAARHELVKEITWNLLSIVSKYFHKCAFVCFLALAAHAHLPQHTKVVAALKFHRQSCSALFISILNPPLN